MKRRAYSLVGVLAALIVFMVVLVPLLGLSGRIFRGAHDPGWQQLQAWIETDLAAIDGSQREWQGTVGGFTVHRRVLSREPRLLEIRYTIETTRGKQHTVTSLKTR